jgi:hypothetical protein
MEVTPMSKTLERPPSAPTAPVRSSLWAWLTLLAWVVFYPLAIGVALTQQDTASGEIALTAWTLFPPAVGIALGARAALTFNCWGALATALGSAALTFLVMFYLGANFLFEGSNDSVPALVAVTMALVVGGAVEAFWHRWFARHST